MNIICNSRPLIFLSKIGKLEIVFQLFDKVYIPQAVYKETLLSGKEDISSIKIVEDISSGNLILFNVKNEVAKKALTGRLHSGEIEVIIGATELGIKDVILDDLSARRKAKQLDLNVTGTLGILSLAFEKNLLNDFETEIQKLINIGFRISPALLQKILNDFKN